jgi:hypothetical protein
MPFFVLKMASLAGNAFDNDRVHACATLYLEVVEILSTSSHGALLLYEFDFVRRLLYEDGGHSKHADATQTSRSLLAKSKGHNIIRYHQIHMRCKHPLQHPFWLYHHLAGRLLFACCTTPLGLLMVRNQMEQAGESSVMDLILSHIEGIFCIGEGRKGLDI